MENQKSRIKEPLFITAIAIAVLVCLSFMQTNYSIEGWKIQNVSILSDILESKLKINPPADTIFSGETANGSSDSNRNDSLVNNGLGATTSITITYEPAAIIDFSHDSIGALDNFFRALMQIKGTKKKVRVAYFGDSMIEGDLLTQDFRESLQKKFGGRGVGFVPVTSIVAGFRRTIIHEFSEDWSDYTLMNPVSPSHPLGLSGHVFTPAPESEVLYRAPKYSSLLNSFDLVKLYYATGNDSNSVITKLDTISKKYILSGSNPVNEIVLNDSNRIRSVSLSFHCPAEQNIYGLSFESQNGVFLDNYSFRGNSGLPLTKIPYTTFNSFNKYFDYDLIILHYGLNVVSHDKKDYSWYGTGLKNLITYIKNVCPNASILIVSVNDRSWKSPDGWVTEPDVPILVNTQKKAAQEKGVAFWNLYEAMGGNNSMRHWVEGDTVLAMNDYAHPNFKGAKKISDLLYKQFMLRFNDYEKKHEAQKP